MNQAHPSHRPEMMYITILPHKIKKCVECTQLIMQQHVENDSLTCIHNVNVECTITS